MSQSIEARKQSQLATGRGTESVIPCRDTGFMFFLMTADLVADRARPKGHVGNARWGGRIKIRIGVQGNV